MKLVNGICHNKKRGVDRAETEKMQKGLLFAGEQRLFSKQRMPGESCDSDRGRIRNHSPYR